MIEINFGPPKKNTRICMKNPQAFLQRIFSFHFAREIRVSKLIFGNMEKVFVAPNQPNRVCSFNR